MIYIENFAFNQMAMQNLNRDNSNSINTLCIHLNPIDICMFHSKFKTPKFIKKFSNFFSLFVVDIFLIFEISVTYFNYLYSFYYYFYSNVLCVCVFCRFACHQKLSTLISLSVRNRKLPPNQCLLISPRSIII